MGLFSEKVDKSTELGSNNGQPSEKALLYVLPGIREVKVKGVNFGKAGTGTPYIAPELYTLSGGPEKSSELRMYISSNNEFIVQGQITHMASKMVTYDEMNEALKGADTTEQIAKALNDLLKGKKFRIKLGGEEYINGSGAKKDRVRLLLANDTNPFAEAIEDGAEYGAVDAENSVLTYDKNNPYDFKKLKEVPTSEDTMDATDGLDEMDGEI